ncbi:MAG: DUF5683 domain-containing protein [Bacteroidetes bacterium]|nr:DUF5683 domain-containing protein [Bacteroidota bacterium]
MKYIIGVALFIFSIKITFFPEEIVAQENIYVDTLITASDFNDNEKNIERKINADYLLLTKSPTRAALRSLVFPGLGQIYTQSYIKSSIFIAGATGLWYMVGSNHIDYKNYNKQLNKIEDKNTYNYRQTQGQMITAVDNRDLAGLYLLGVYILSMVDAYADAHLFDFNIDSNLSYFIKPAINEFNQTYIRIGISYSF